MNQEFKLVPASMLLDKPTIGAINFHCGDGSNLTIDECSEGILWVGTVTDDDGKEVYGLHIQTAEYPEEGSTTLVEFAAQPITESEVAVRQQLADVSNERDGLRALNDKVKAHVSRLCKVAGSQPSIATGYMRDVLELFDHQSAPATDEQGGGVQATDRR